MNITNYQEIWQIDIGGEIYEASFEIMAQWIYEGSLLPQDKVRRGNLRWIEAQKVPALLQFFNGKEQGLPPPVFSSTDAISQNTVEIQPTQNQLTVSENPYQTNLFTTPEPQNHQATTVQQTDNYRTNIVTPPENYQSNQISSQPSYTANFVDSAQTSQNPFEQFPPQNAPAGNACVMHPDAAVAFLCETCGNGFCPACPKSYGGSVKICPFCGAMCEPITKVQQKAVESVRYHTAISKGFGFEDFFNALAYPFKFRVSLIAGAIMFMFFQLGQSAAAMGMSIFLMGAAICCWMLSNMLTFGILANTVENFSQGKINLNFMPDFDDFSLWDDVVHPFFLSLGTYLVSFGLLFIFIAGLVYFTWTTFNGNAPISMEKRIEMAQKEQEERRDKVAAEFKENHPELYTETEEDKELEQLQKDLQFQRKKEIESVAGKTPEEEAQDRQEMISNFKQLGLPAVGVAILLMFWGLFYFPAACLVAGYTRSFWATLNPAIGLETIKLLGWDYLKILVMLFIISAAIYFLTILLGVIFYAFNMPSIGNIPAKAVGSLIGFYFSVVFAVILGFALYKNSEKLKLFRN
jgi:hypothetical protein